MWGPLCGATYVGPPVCLSGCLCPVLRPPPFASLPVPSVCTVDSVPECPCLSGCLCSLCEQFTEPQCALLYVPAVCLVVCVPCVYSSQYPSVPYCACLLSVCLSGPFVPSVPFVQVLNLHKGQ